jgi:hypothetical protein
MSKQIAAILVMMTAPPVVADTGSSIPVWCCPISCVAIDGPVRIGGSDVSTEYDGFETAAPNTPLSKNVFIGESPDDRVHVCIGFTDFGDREIKCLLTPPMM